VSITGRIIWYIVYFTNTITITNSIIYHLASIPIPIPIPIQLYQFAFTFTFILVAPRFKNILRLEAGYPALRCHNLNNHNQQVTRTQHTRDKNKDDTGNTKTPKHSHTHKTHSRNDERQRLSSCCHSRRRRPRDHRRWFDARRAAEGGDVVGLTVRSMVTVATRREEEHLQPRDLKRKEKILGRCFLCVCCVVVRCVWVFAGCVCV